MTKRETELREAQGAAQRAELLRSEQRKATEEEAERSLQAAAQHLPLMTGAARQLRGMPVLTVAIPPWLYPRWLRAAERRSATYHPHPRPLPTTPGGARREASPRPGA